MTVAEYQTAAMQTAIYPGSGTPLGLCYAALGLCGEVGEISDVVFNIQTLSAEQLREKLICEIGGACWYCAAIMRELEDNLELLASHATPTPFHTLIKVSGLIANQTKKVLRDDESKITGARRGTISYFCAVCFYQLAVLARMHGIPFEEILAANVAKLADRKERGALKGDGDNR